MKYFYLIVIALSLQGCARYYFSLPSEEYLAESGTPSVFSFNDSYELYLRKTYRKDRIISRDSINEGNRLIEKVFLLVSQKEQTAVYITFRPDKYQSLYEGSTQQDGLINLYYLRSLQFGKLNDKGQEITFFDKKDKGNDDIWIFSRQQHRLTIERIEEQKNGAYNHTLNTSQAFGNPISFTKIGAYKIIYQEPKDSLETDPKFIKWQAPHELTKNRLLIYPKYEELFLSFTDQGNKNEIKILYDKNRMLYKYQPFFNILN